MVRRQPGREGAVAALIEAARDLFADRGPNAVSLRDVARQAGLSHGLIHHYIGSRDDLLRMVFADSTEHARQQVESIEDPVEALRELRRRYTGGDYGRLLAWALLEGFDLEELQGRSAALDAIVETSGVDTRELRLVLAAAIVNMLGWKMFGTFAVTAAGLSDADVHDARLAAERLIDDAVRNAFAADQRPVRKARSSAAKPGNAC